MEETLTPEPQPAAEQPQGIILLQDAQTYLVTAGKWARFLAILGFIVSGLVACMALFVGAFMSALSGFSPMGNFARGAAAGGIVSFVYILIAIFHFFVALYMYQFGTKVKNGVAFQNSNEVGAGLEKLKSFFKLLGIAAIVIMVLYVLIFIAVITFAGHGFVTPTAG